MPTLICVDMYWCVGESWFQNCWLHLLIYSNRSDCPHSFLNTPKNKSRRNWHVLYNIVFPHSAAEALLKRCHCWTLLAIHCRSDCCAMLPEGGCTSNTHTHTVCCLLSSYISCVSLFQPAFLLLPAWMNFPHKLGLQRHCLKTLKRHFMFA